MLYKLHIIHPGVEKSSDRGWRVVLEEGGFISSLGGGGGESFPTHTNLRKGLVRPQRRGLEEPGDLSGGLPCVHCLALGCRVCSQSHSPWGGSSRTNGGTWRYLLVFMKMKGEQVP